jgi:hypothetical protein
MKTLNRTKAKLHRLFFALILFGLAPVGAQATGLAPSTNYICAFHDLAAGTPPQPAAEDGRTVSNAQGHYPCN